MKEINTSQDLKDAISELEHKKAAQEFILKSKFNETVENFKPTNILKNTISEVAAMPKMKHNILNIVLGLGAGYFSKKLVIGKSAGLLQKALGTALQFGVTSLVSKTSVQDDYNKPQKKGNLLKRIFSKSSS